MIGLWAPWLACADPRTEEADPPLVWLFRHHDEDDDALAARIGRLEELARQAFDPDGARADRTFDPGALPEDTRGTTAVAVVQRSEQELPDHLLLAGEPNRVCIEGDGWQAWWRTFTLGGDCLPLGGCREAASDESARRVAPDAAWWLSVHTAWRQVELPDQREALLSVTGLGASTSDDPADRFDVRDGVQVWVPDALDDGYTWRFDATWGRMQIDGAAPSDLASRLANDALDGFDQTDLWLSGHRTCAWDRDAAPQP